jgi:hypothetical protein
MEQCPASKVYAIEYNFLANAGCRRELERIKWKSENDFASLEGIQLTK